MVLQFEDDQQKKGKVQETVAENAEWISCPGYTCGLWQLFHSMALNIEPHEGMIGLLTIKGMVKSLFGCSECRSHFIQATEEPAAKRVRTRRDLVLWLWKQHNSVTARLAGEPQNSANSFQYPKVQWPTRTLCPTCRDEKGTMHFPILVCDGLASKFFNQIVGEWILDNVFTFLEQFYGSEKKLGSDGTSFGLQQWLSNEVQTIEEIAFAVVLISFLVLVAIYFGSRCGMKLATQYGQKEVFVKACAWILVKIRGEKTQHGQ